MNTSRVPRHSSRMAACQIVAPLLLIPLAAGAQTTDTWSLGTSGLWNVAGNWSAAVVPNNGTPSGSTYNVDILDGKSTVSLNISTTIDDLTLSKGNTLAIENGEALTVDGPTVANSGAITLAGGGGTFASITGLTINSTESYSVTYQPTDVLLTVVSTRTARTTDTTLSGAGSLVEDRARVSAALRDFNADFARGGRATLAMEQNRVLARQRTPEHVSALQMIRAHR